MLNLNVMSKITIKDPYAFNGDALTKGSSPASKGFLSKKKNNTIKAKKHFYIESYGCQMNFSDSEIVASILNQEGYELTEKLENAKKVIADIKKLKLKIKRGGCKRKANNK